MSTIFLEKCECDCCGVKYFEERNSDDSECSDDVPPYCKTQGIKKVIVKYGNIQQARDFVMCQDCKTGSLDDNFKPQYKKKRYYHKCVHETEQTLPNAQQLEGPKEKAYFFCDICGLSGISEDKLEDHHSKVHANISMACFIFKFVAIRSNGKCSFCGAIVDEVECKQHVEQFHSPTPILTGNGILIRHTLLRSMSCLQPFGPNLNGFFVHLFMCQVCRAQDVLEYDRLAHHMQYHSNINYNIFSEPIGIVPLQQCDVCGKHLIKGWLNSHKKSPFCYLDHLVKMNVMPQPINRDDIAQTTKPMVEAMNGMKIHEVKLDPPIREERKFPSMKIYFCEICGRNGITQDKLEEHHLQEHRQISMLRAKDIFRFVAYRQNGECSVCDEVVGENEFKEHVEEFHPSTPIMVKKGKKVDRYVFLRFTPCDGEDGLNHVNNNNNNNNNNNIPERNNNFSFDADTEEVKETEGPLGAVHRSESTSPSNTSNRSQLTQQNWNDSFVKLFNCRICGTNNILEYRRVEHQRVAHQLKTNGPIQFDMFHDVGYLPLEQCDICGKRLIKGWLNSHKKISHGCIDHSTKNGLLNQSKM